MSRRPNMQLVAIALACASVWMLLMGTASAAELVMCRRDGCFWCARWDSEIGPIYPKTDLSKRAPLRMVNLDRGADRAVALKSPIIYTPTFVAAEAGREVARLEGYPGLIFFWPLIERVVAQLPASGQVAPSQKGSSFAPSCGVTVVRAERTP